MSLAPETGLTGTYYVIKVKLTGNKDWDYPDALYAIGYKDNSKFGIMDLKTVTDDKNEAFCLSFKVSETDHLWEDCLEEMKVKPPLGNPLLLTDRRYSFVEIT